MPDLEDFDRLDQRPALHELQQDAASRKRFLKLVGVGGAGAFVTLLTACGSKSSSSSSSAPAPAPAPAASTPSTASSSSTPAAAPSGGQDGDLAIVNYALTLEHIEADFYQQVIDSGMIKDKKAVELAKRIGENEKEHVQALTATVKKLGGTPAGAPKTKFGPVIQGGPKMILKTAAMVENLGASAYLGQAGKIKSPEILAAALAIHTVEARHAAALNKLAGNGFKSGKALVGSIPDGAFAKPMSMDEVLAVVKPFLA